MKTSTCLILGSFLLIQAAPRNEQTSFWSMIGVGADVVMADESGSLERAPASVPLYHESQAKELLGFGEILEHSGRDRSQDLAAFVKDRVNDALPERWKGRAEEISHALVATANEHEMDPLFLMALIQTESRFIPTAVGRHGEIGLMQMKPSTARWLIEEGLVDFDPDQVEEGLANPVTNIAFGTAYLALLRDSFRESFKNNSTAYIAAYNMGALNARRLLRNGQKPRIYSDRVLGRYATLALEFSSSANFPALRVASLSEIAPADLVTSGSQTQTFDLR